jgi:hypothetical protein
MQEIERLMVCGSYAAALTRINEIPSEEIKSLNETVIATLRKECEERMADLTLADDADPIKAGKDAEDESRYEKLKRRIRTRSVLAALVSFVVLGLVIALSGFMLFEPGPLLAGLLISGLASYSLIAISPLKWLGQLNVIATGGLVFLFLGWRNDEKTEVLIGLLLLSPSVFVYSRKTLIAIGKYFKEWQERRKQ